MSYFPSDIPFMSDGELKENDIYIPKDVSDTNVGNIEYIRREDAKNLRFSGGINHDGFLYVPYKELVDGIKAMPSADVAPVVHGRWKKQYRYQVNSICSVCGNEVGRCTRYCPNCGAKMDGGDEHG